MICENCFKEIDEIYGSGRFCNKKCACAFSTKNKRLEINLKVSEKLKGRPPAHPYGFKKGFDPRRGNNKPWTIEMRVEASQKIRKKNNKLYSTLTWDDLPNAEKRRRVFSEQNGKCLFCNLNEWMNKKITLEIDHINGDHYDNKRENLRILCPNCHSQTPTYRKYRQEK